MDISKPVFSTGIFLKKDRLHKNYEVIDRFGGRIYLYNGKTKEDNIWFKYININLSLLFHNLYSSFILFTVIIS